MNKNILLILTSLISLSGFCQFNETEFKTDSSEVELIRNSVYRIWEESINDKDSVFYSVRYISDTSQINTEGWKRKNGQYFGEWSEYQIDGTWLYTIDYTNNSWKYNEDKFKFQYLKDSMKTKADIILINKFGQDFFDNNIVFRFHGHTNIGKWETYGKEKYWRQKYLGSWIEPINQKPNSYVIDYTIKIGPDELYNDMLRVELDSIGNLISEPSRFETSFQEIKVPMNAKFSITRKDAIELCKINKIDDKEKSSYESNLRFGWRKLAEYPGQFYYEVVSFIKEEVEGDCPKNCLIKNYYYVWRFDPWTSALIQNEKMIKYSRYLNGHGVSGGYEIIKE